MARASGDVRDDVPTVDLPTLANAVSPAAEADRLLTLALTGLHPRER
ncbi:hypothetical protein LZG04_29480 [Saccharothrix sp. S26]|nr:hypothetical protein [Saccharothrix sp. S26]MCE6998900.1 hypothetical protein [Saccharothrix sp. S26]